VSCPIGELGEIYVRLAEGYLGAAATAGKFKVVLVILILNLSTLKRRRTRDKRPLTFFIMGFW
jgi:hypothetical protein